jgi:ERCC4-type nuclease
MIVIDTREPESITEQLREEASDVEVTEEHLDTGDFLAGSYIVERKQYGDFIGRMTNSERDVWQQVLAMESAADELGYTPVLLLEGEWAEAMRWSSLTPKEPTMAIGSIMKLGISVVHTYGPRASCQLLVKLGDDSSHDVGSIRDSPSVPPEMYPRYMTEGFVGVGTARAEDILDRYSSFASVVRQLLEDPEDLKEIHGIGDATVEKMVDMVTREWE